MEVIIDNYKNIKSDEELTLTIGNFDGLHLGHQSLIKTTLLFQDTIPAVMTFNPHPISFFRKISTYTLMTIEDKIKVTKNLGVKKLFIVNFDEEFANLSKEGFVKMLKDLKVKRLVVGSDFKFAAKASGNVEYLKEHFEVILIDNVLFANSRVSTTYVKDLLKEGALNIANHLLSRPYEITGPVIHGNKVGHKLNFPTANIDYSNYVLPKNGVYLVEVSINGDNHFGICSIGNNPTINYSEKKRLEVYILNFKEYIYDQVVTVSFIKYLRAEKYFKNKAELIKEMYNDKDNALKLIKTMKLW